MCVTFTLLYKSMISGFHHRWNSRVDRRHPSIWVFIRCLKDEQRVVETTCAIAERGSPAPPQRRKWRVLEERFESFF